MALHSGIDTVAFVSGGAYSITYGVGEEGNLANLFAFYGLLEDAPEGAEEADTRKPGLNRMGFSLRID